MTDQSTSLSLVNIHGLLGEPEGSQIELDLNQLNEGSHFVYDNVSYEIVRIIMADVEHPIVYVVLLDILPQN